MNTVVVILVIVGLAYVGFKYLSQGGNQHHLSENEKHRRTPRKEGVDVLNENMEWLEKEWEILEREMESGSKRRFLYWFFSDASQDKILELEKRGITLQNSKPKTGHIDDVLGLFLPARENDVKIIKEFGESSRGINRTKAKYLAHKMLKGEEYSKKREQRQATKMQKEFFRFFKIKIPSDLTYNVAEIRYRDTIKTLSEEQVRGWLAYESIYEELSDPEIRSDYNIKKVSLTLYRKAIESLREQGRDWEELEDEIDYVVDEIISLQPEIEK